MGIKEWLKNTFTSVEESSKNEEITHLDEIAEKIKEKHPKLEPKEKNFLSFYYNLKELQIRLQNYDDLKSKKRNKRDVALLALKQLWINKVDSSFEENQTLIDAFLVTGYLKELKNTQQIDNEINKLDLNKDLKDILREKIPEFHKWIETSEKKYREDYFLNKQKIKEIENDL